MDRAFRRALTLATRTRARQGKTQAPDGPRRGEDEARLVKNVTTDLERAAQLFELWRLCRKSNCRRARGCRGDARACCESLTEWSEALSLRDKRIGFAEALKRLRER
ncbi:MAG: hypothetical protein WBD76_09885 [Methyloceanibacter sp.]